MKFIGINIHGRATGVLLMFALLFTIKYANGQTNKWDVIMLKSAEVVRGTITDSIPGTSVTILAGDSLSRTIARADIQLITTETRRAYFTQRKNDLTDKGTSQKLASYQGFLAAGFAPGKEDTESIRINFVNGVGFGQTMSVGFGLGLRMPLQREDIVVPVFFDMRFRILKSKIAPIIAMGLGECFQPSRELKDTGQLISFEAGISIKNSGKSSLLLTVGYEAFTIINGPDSPAKVGLWTYTAPVVHYEDIQSITINFAVGF